tara:strand:- start:888 stop:1607 length:720 start_codon:yes stop_codon:yes gene_type:complete
MKNKYVFVYGTLKTGGYNNVLLKNSEFVGRTTLPNYYMFSNGWFPYITHKRNVPVAVLQDFYNKTGEETSLIIGEIWNVSQTTLENIRNLEGVPEHYLSESFEFQLEKMSNDGMIKNDIRGMAEFYVASRPSVLEMSNPVYSGYFNVDKNLNVKWRVIIDDNKIEGTAIEIVKKLRRKSFDTNSKNNAEYMESVNKRLHKFHRNSKMRFEDESHFLNFLAERCVIAEWDEPINAKINYA